MGHESEPIIVAGMHRSFTSLMASCLEALGVDLGANVRPADRFNPTGYHEDVEFLDLDRRMIAAALGEVADAGWADWGWVPGRSLGTEALSTFEAEAATLVARRASGKVWGFKDPRTALLVNFWQRVIPSARFVFVYRHPADVLHSIERLGEPALTHDAARSIWLEYNREILAAVRERPDRCTLVEGAALGTDPVELIGLLRQRFQLEPIDADLAALLQSNEDVAIAWALRHRLVARGVAAPIGPTGPERYGRLDPELADVLEQLDASADVRSLGTVPDLADIVPRKNPQQGVRTFHVVERSLERSARDAALADLRCRYPHGASVALVGNANDEPPESTATLAALGVTVVASTHMLSAVDRDAEHVIAELVSLWRPPDAPLDPAIIRADVDAAKSLARFRWLARAVPRGAVLVVGDDGGVGSEVLAAAGHAVTVVFPSDAGRQLAQTRASASIRYEYGDSRSVPVPDAAFSAVLALDVDPLDHDIDKVLDELSRCVRDGGTLVIAQPAGAALSQLLDELGARFDTVVVARQRSISGSMISTADGEGSVLTAVHRIDDSASEADDAIVLASTAPVALPGPVAEVVDAGELRRWQQLWDEQAAVLRQQLEHISRMERADSELRSTKAMLLEAEQTIANLPQQREALVALRAELDAQRGEAVSARAETDGLAARVAALESSTSWRATALLRWVTGRLRSRH